MIFKLRLFAIFTTRISNKSEFFVVNCFQTKFEAIILVMQMFLRLGRLANFFLLFDFSSSKTG